MATISIAQVLGQPHARLHSEGQRVARQLLVAAQQSRAVALSFAGLQHVTTAFLMAALSEVLRQYPAFAALLVCTDVPTPSIAYKLAEVQRVALDAEYRQQLADAWAEVTAGY